jgi:hypothetical protein
MAAFRFRVPLAICLLDQDATIWQPNSFEARSSKNRPQPRAAEALSPKNVFGCKQLRVDTGY